MIKDVNDGLSLKPALQIKVNADDKKIISAAYTGKS